MKKQRHFGTANGIAERDTAVIAAMMDDLCRIVEILDCDVATEEERARVFDRVGPPLSDPGEDAWPPGEIISN